MEERSWTIGWGRMSGIQVDNWGAGEVKRLRVREEAD